MINDSKSWKENFVFRGTLPPLAIISPKDPSPSFWSKPGPTWTELNRLVTLAHLTIEKLDAQVRFRKIC